MLTEIFHEIYMDLCGQPFKRDWVSKDVQTLQISGGRCDRYF